MVTFLDDVDAPHSQRPDQFVNKLRRDVPLWAVCSVLSLISALGYLDLRTSLIRTLPTK
jgi:type VI secretion system protein ImpK